MTLRELIDSTGQHSLPVLSILAAVPVVSFLVGMSHGRGEGHHAPWKFAYAALVYLACIPGIFAAVLTAYTLFFGGESLLDVNPLIYFLPIATMVVTLLVIRKRVSFEDVPGFDRLTGLMILMGGSFAIALAIHKTRIFIGFFGSVEMLFVLAAVVFGLLRWGGVMLFRSSGDESRAAPKFPSTKPQD